RPLPSGPPPRSPSRDPAAPPSTHRHPPTRAPAHPRTPPPFLTFCPLPVASKAAVRQWACLSAQEQSRAEQRAESRQSISSPPPCLSCPRPALGAKRETLQAHIYRVGWLHLDRSCSCPTPHVRLFTHKNAPEQQRQHGRDRGNAPQQAAA